MPESTKMPRRPRRGSTRLTELVLQRLDSIEGQIAHVRAEVTVQANEVSRVMRLVVELNRRCLERLGEKCPMEEVTVETPVPEGEGG